MNSAITLKVYAKWLRNDEADRRQADLLEPDLGTKSPARHGSPDPLDEIAVLHN
jgi:hypothetical protein